MSSSQNNGDIWLDTAELREKKRKRQMRPISKLLNPLARCGGYSVAVALNFTQTKLDMPVTKQSTISSFFSPQRKDELKDAEKKSVFPAEPYANAPHAVSIKSSDLGQQNSMKNTDTLPEKDVFDKTGAKACGEESVRRRETDHCTDSCNWKKEQTFLHLIRGYESEEEVQEPEGKRRFSESRSIKVNKLAPVHQLSQAKCCLPVPETLPLSQWEYNTQDFQCLKMLHQKNIPEEQDSVFCTSQLSERGFRAQIHLPENTSAQRKVSSPLHSPAKHAGKENCPSSAARGRDLVRSGSPLKMIPLSPSSPAAKSRSWEMKCLSPRRPVSEVAQKDFETDSMASLFTQDSQGFRVIAHRNHQSWSPLKDRANNTSGGVGWNVPFAGAVDGEADSELEPEMLFTQDSQGNLVMKH